MNRKTIGLAMCGSFCTFARVLDAFSALDREQYDLVPIQSQAAYATDTRFGAAADFRARLEALCGRPIIHTIEEAEPIGPKKLLDVLVIAPCTGNTLAKLAAGIADGPVTLAAKAHLRNERPDRPRRLDQRRSGRQRREPRRAFKPPRLLFRPLRPGQRHQKAPFPRRRLPPAPRRPRRRPARPSAPADALRGEDVTSPPHCVRHLIFTRGGIFSLAPKAPLVKGSWPEGPEGLTPPQRKKGSPPRGGFDTKKNPARCRGSGRGICCDSLCLTVPSSGSGGA